MKDLAAWLSSGFGTCLPKFWHPAAGLFTPVAARIAPSQDAQPQRFRARSPARPSESAHVRAASMGRRLLPFVLGTTFPNGPSRMGFHSTFCSQSDCGRDVSCGGLSPQLVAHRTIALTTELRTWTAHNPVNLPFCWFCLRSTIQSLSRNPDNPHWTC